MKLFKERKERFQHGDDFGKTITTYQPASLQDIRQAAKEMGYVVVPMEPTEAMLDGWFQAMDRNGYHMAGSDLGVKDAADTYKAMIQAAEAAE